MSDRLSEPMTEARLQAIEDLPWIPPLTVIVAELLQEVKRLRSLLHGRPVAEAPRQTSVLLYIGDGDFVVAWQYNDKWKVSAMEGATIEPEWPEYWWPLPEVPQ